MPRLLRDRLNPLEFYREDEFLMRCRLCKGSFVLLCDILTPGIQNCLVEKLFSSTHLNFVHMSGFFHLEQGCQTYGPRARTGPRDDPKKHKNHTIGLYLLLVIKL